MKVYNAILTSLGVSLGAGAVLFLIISTVIQCFIFDKITPPIEDIFIVAAVFFIIYFIIQILLSTINMIQANIISKQEGSNIDGNIIHPFFIAEAILYLIVFLFVMACIREFSFIPMLLAFSIPYIICCTLSVFLFRRFLYRAGADVIQKSEIAIQDGME